MSDWRGIGSRGGWVESEGVEVWRGGGVEEFYPDTWGRDKSIGERWLGGGGQIGKCWKR